MPDLKIVLGTVNYTDYLRVSVAKVSDPGTEVFVEYINTPVTNYTLIVPGLDADNYYVSFRDAPNTSSLGTLVSQAFVNALTNEWEYERRFYEVGALPSGVTIVGKVLNDPYLQNRNVTGIFKEGFRYLVNTTEYTFDDATGDVELVSPSLDFSDGEQFIVEVKYAVGVSSTTTAAGLFASTVTVTASTYSVLSTNKYKRHCLDASGTTQVATLPSLSALATGDYFYFEHKRNGAQAQSKIVTAGTDKIYFNGFEGLTELTEIWLAKSESVYLRKEGSFWEIVFDYAGTRVGERMAATFNGHTNWLPEDGSLLDGDEYPGLYWWIRNILPNTHYVTDDAVTSGSYTHPAGKEGMFVIHSTLKKFRLPNTQGFSEKALKDFDSFGSDTERVYDYPGGVQNEQVGKHRHDLLYYRNDSQGGGQQYNYYLNNDNGPTPLAGAYKTDYNIADGENRVKNIGVVYLRRI